MTESDFVGRAFLRDSCDGVRIEVRWTEAQVRIYEHTLDGDVQLGLTIQRGGQAQELATLLRSGPSDEQLVTPLGVRPYDTQLEWLERCLREKAPPPESVLEAVTSEATVTGPPCFVHDPKRRKRVLEIVGELRAMLRQPAKKKVRSKRSRRPAEKRK